MQITLYSVKLIAEKTVCWLFFGMVASGIFVSGALASDADVEEEEGEAMIFELPKPTWSNGVTFDEKVRYSYSVNDVEANYGADHYVQGGRTGKIVWSKGQISTVEFKVNLKSDDIDEGAGEKFNLILNSPQYEVVPGVYLYGFGLPANIKYTGLILEID